MEGFPTAEDIYNVLQSSHTQVQEGLRRFRHDAAKGKADGDVLQEADKLVPGV